MQRIDAKNLIDRIDRDVIFDTRSPAEFAAGHVPGAVSLPIFGDSERQTIGTIYKQESSTAALLKGLDFAGPKMKRLVEQATQLAPEKKAIVHCWRGGQRSAAMAWLLDFAGFQIDVVEGGYKAYRREVLAGVNDPSYHFIVLGGQTGSGKTELLIELAKRGEQIVDLEGLANHKGSAFGWIGEQPQPTTEQFENSLFEVMRKLDRTKRIWIENESRGIGRVFLPVEFAQRLRTLPLVNISIDFDLRVSRLVETYAQNKSELKASFEKITRKLGGQHLKTALEALERHDFRTAAEIALVYYDQTYQYSLDRAKPGQLIDLDFDSQSRDEIVDCLIKLDLQIEASTLSSLTGTKNTNGTNQTRP